MKVKNGKNRIVSIMVLIGMLLTSLNFSENVGNVQAAEAGNSVIYSQDFESVADASGNNVSDANISELLDEWSFIQATGSTAPTATAKVEQVGDTKALVFNQAANDSTLSGNPTLRLALGDSYDNIELSFDVKANQASGKLDIAIGQANDTASWMRGALTMNGGKLYELNKGNALETYTADTWHSVRIVYKKDTEGTRSYDIYFDSNKILTDANPNADVAVNYVIIQMYRGSVGSFCIDNIVVKEIETTVIQQVANDVVYVNMDKTTGSDWEGTYGNTQAILLAKSYTGEVDYSKNGLYGGANRFVLNPENAYDYSSNAASGITYEGSYGGGLYLFDEMESGGTALKSPSNAAETTFNAYAMDGWSTQYASNPNYPGAGYEIAGSNRRTAHTFTLPEGKTYLFSVYSNNGLNASGNVIFTFLTMDNDILAQKTVTTSDFNGGTYITFLVRGSFKLYIDKTATFFGVNGFFFDEAAENFTSDLTAEAGSQARSIALSWKEKIEEEASVVIYRKKAADTEWSEIATVPSGTKNYLDKELEAGAAYSYKLRTIKGKEYSYFGEEVTYTVSAYTFTAITLDKDNYTVSDATKEVTVTITLNTDSHDPCVGQEVSLCVNWEFDSSIVQSVGTKTTDANGQASFVFQPEYLGDGQIWAAFADNDDEKLQNSSASASLFVGEENWTKAPVVWRISDAVLPGDLISLYGYGMNAESESDLSVKFAPHTSDVVSVEPPENATELSVIQTDMENGYYIVVQFPEEADPGVYDVWVKNAVSWSAPITLNAARPLFISEYEVWAGQQIEVSGRAMDARQFGCDMETKVRLVSGKNKFEQTVTKYSPYSLTFTVGDVPLAEYEVEISNDSGVTWRPVDCDQTLTVVEVGVDPLGLGVAWMDHFAWDNVFDITDYGAVADDTTDDTAAIVAAMEAAKASDAGGGVVYMPKGNYYITTLDIPANIVLLGESMEDTILTYCGENVTECMFEGRNEDRTTGHLGFARFSIRLADPDKGVDVFFWLGHDWDDSNKYPALRKASEFFLYEVDLTYSFSGFATTTNGHRGLGAVILGNERFIMQDCKFEGFAACPSYIKMNYYGTYRGNYFYYERGAVQNMASYTFMEDNYLTSWFGKKEDSEYVIDSHGLFGRNNVHMENNYVEKVGSMESSSTAHAWGNDGETYCVEPSVTLSYGNVVNSTAKTITVSMYASELQTLEAYAVQYGRVTVVIHDGRGMGQMRDVAAIDLDTKTITVTEDWDVLPDSTSKFTFSLTIDNVTVYNNEDADSAKGVYLYGCVYDSVVANHKSINTEGIYVHSAQVYNGSSDRVWNAYYTSIRDNEITGVSRRTNDAKIAVGTERSINGSEYYGVSTFGTEIRNNVITGVKGLESTKRTEGCPESGIVSMSSRGKANSDNVAGDTTCVIIEDNVIKSQDVGITYSLSDYGVVLKNNIFEDCTVETQQCLDTQVDKDAVIEHITTVDSSITSNLVSAYTKVLGTVNTVNYTDETAERFTAAIAQATSVVLLRAADQNSILTLAMQELRASYTGLKWKENPSYEVPAHVHKPSDEWKSDKETHWHACECGERVDEAEHTFTWKVVREATETEKGRKEDTCSVCGYVRASADISTKGNSEKEDTNKENTNKGNTNKDNTNKDSIAGENGSDVTESGSTAQNIKSPKTGDDISQFVWILLVITCGAGIAGRLLFLKKRQNRA